MPMRPPVHSSYRGPKLKRQADRERASRHERGYDSIWVRVRLGFLAANPLCVDCKREGLVTASTEAHHVQRIADHPDLRLDPRNLMALCKAHHSTRTRRGE